MNITISSRPEFANNHKNKLNYRLVAIEHTQRKVEKDIVLDSRTCLLLN